jgi:hypothetical protein
VEAWQEGEVNAPEDNRRQHYKEAPADKRQSHRRTGARGTNGVSWQHGEWQRQQQEGGGGTRAGRGREAEVNFCFIIFWERL